MILLDPDLDPDPAPQKKSARRPDALASQTASPSHRMPSARSLALFLREAQAAAKLRGHVTVLLTTDAAIRKLNRRFRDKDRPTDVLSFPTAGPLAAEMAGDLAISIPTARRQAAERGHSLAIEMKVLILHGLLHLAGFDHEADAGQMDRRERLLRSRLRLPQGLIERVEAGMPAAPRVTKSQPRRAARGVRK
jgi:probable rRNA maturation factor